MHPEVGVRVDDPAFRDSEKILGRDVEKSEASEIKMCAEIVCFYGGGITSDNSVLARHNRTMIVSLIRIGIYQAGKPCDFSTAIS